MSSFALALVGVGLDFSVVLRPFPRGLGMGSGSRLVGAIPALGGRRVHGGSLVLHISHVTIDVVSPVCHDLDTAVGQVDAILALQVAVLILLLNLVKVGPSVFVLDTVLVCVGAGRFLVLLLPVGRSSRGWSSHRNCGAVGGGYSSQGKANDEGELKQ